MDREYVVWLRRGDAQTLALADGEVVDSVMASDDLARGCHKLTGTLRKRFSLLLKVGAEERLIVAVGNEADLLRVGLVRDA